MFDAYPKATDAANCAALTLPNVLAEDCVDADSVEVDNESEIQFLLMSEVDPANPDAPLYKPTDVTSAAAWATAIVNTGAGIKKLYVIGDMPVPSKTTRQVSGGRKRVGKKQFVANLDVDDTNNTTYDASRIIEGGAEVFIWLVTKGNKLYGADAIYSNGIRAFIDNDIDLQRGDAYESIKITAEWEAFEKPPRIDWPV